LHSQALEYQSIMAKLIIQKEENYNLNKPSKIKDALYVFPRGSSSAIDFEFFIEALDVDGSQYKEDILVGLVKNDSVENYDDFFNKSLRILHEDDSNLLLENISKVNGNCRLIGYPSVNKSIESNDDFSHNVIKAQVRGFYGKYKKIDGKKYLYEVYDTNWKEDSLSGFSGSPIIEFIPYINEQGILDYEAVPLGIILTEKRFISINIITEILSKYYFNLENQK